MCELILGFVLIIIRFASLASHHHPLDSTVRVNTEQQEGVLRTSQRTHASTRQVCGTHPYVSAALSFHSERVANRPDSLVD